MVEQRSAFLRWNISQDVISSTPTHAPRTCRPAFVELRNLSAVFPSHCYLPRHRRKRRVISLDLPLMLNHHGSTPQFPPVSLRVRTTLFFTPRREMEAHKLNVKVSLRGRFSTSNVVSKMNERFTAQRIAVVPTYPRESSGCQCMSRRPGPLSELRLPHLPPPFPAHFNRPKVSPCAASVMYPHMIARGFISRDLHAREEPRFGVAGRNPVDCRENGAHAPTKPGAELKPTGCRQAAENESCGARRMFERDRRVQSACMGRFSVHSLSALGHVVPFFDLISLFWGRPPFGLLRHAQLGTEPTCPEICGRRRLWTTPWSFFAARRCG